MSEPTTTPSDTERFPIAKKGEHFNVLDLVQSSEHMDTAEAHCAGPTESSQNPSGLSENKLELANAKEGQVMLDGVMCLGRTWNFVEGPVATQIYDEPRVVVRSRAYYNGLPEVTESAYYYEIPFADIEEATLSLIIVSHTDQRITLEGDVIPVDYGQMSGCFLILLTSATGESGGETLQHFQDMEPGIIVYRNEWEQVGNQLANDFETEFVLVNTHFPVDAKFYFLITQFEQSQTIEPTERISLKPELRMQHVDRLSVHVAVDFEHDDNKILFFNSKFAGPLHCEPDYNKYNPCLVPETGEYVYSHLPPNGFNVLALRQYTRLFQAVHRNENGFFHKPFIADTILTTYLEYLNGRNKLEWEPNVKKIMGPALAELRDATLELLKSKAPIKSRFQFVWSRDLSVEQRSSFENYQSQAVDQCLQIMRTSHCANTSLFTVHPRSPICEYLTLQLNTFFNSILSAVETLRTKVLEERPTNIVPDSPTLTLEDFAAALLSEAMITRLTRGTFDGYPNFICELVFQELNTERSVLKWPFDEHKMREQQEFLVVKDICVTKCFPKLDIANQIIFYDLLFPNLRPPYTLYNQWMSLPTNAPEQALASATCNLLAEIFNHFLEKLLQHNLMEASNDEALRKIWNSGALDRHQEAETHSTSSLYGRLFELSRALYSELQIPLLMLELAKMELVAKFRGGAGLSVAMIMDELMYKGGVPFILRLPERIIQIVYVPYTLPETKSTARIIRIYQEAFKVSFGRSMGRAGIHVDTFLVPLVTHIQSLKMDYRPKDMNPIFKLVNKFLDNDNAKTSLHFAKLSAGIRNIMLTPHIHQDAEVVLPPKEIKAREVELDVFLENKMEVDDAELVESLSNTERSALMQPVASCSSAVASQTIPSHSQHVMPLSTERSEVSAQEALANDLNDVNIHNSSKNDNYADDDEGCEDPSILLRGYLFRRNRQMKTHTLCDNLVFEGDSFM